MSGLDTSHTSPTLPPPVGEVSQVKKYRYLPHHTHTHTHTSHTSPPLSPKPEIYLKELDTTCFCHRGRLFLWGERGEWGSGELTPFWLQDKGLIRVF